jgi:hypothetical protein
MGHASSRAAMIYQHISKDRDRHIADGLSAQIENARDEQGDEVNGWCGTRVARGWIWLSTSAREGAGNQALTRGKKIVETRGLEPLTPALQRRFR